MIKYVDITVPLIPKGTDIYFWKEENDSYFPNFKPYEFGKLTYSGNINVNESGATLVGDQEKSCKVENAAFSATDLWSKFLETLRSYAYAGYAQSSAILHKLYMLGYGTSTHSSLPKFIIVDRNMSIWAAYRDNSFPYDYTFVSLTNSYREFKTQAVWQHPPTNLIRSDKNIEALLNAGFFYYQNYAARAFKGIFGVTPIEQRSYLIE